jgi:hypothetical protein
MSLFPSKAVWTHVGNFETCAVTPERSVPGGYTPLSGGIEYILTDLGYQTGYNLGEQELPIAYSNQAVTGICVPNTKDTDCSSSNSSYWDTFDSVKVATAPLGNDICYIVDNAKFTCPPNNVLVATALGDGITPRVRVNPTDTTYVNSAGLCAPLADTYALDYHNSTYHITNEYPYMAGTNFTSICPDNSFVTAFCRMPGSTDTPQDCTADSCCMTPDGLGGRSYMECTPVVKMTTPFIPLMNSEYEIQHDKASSAHNPGSICSSGSNVTIKLTCPPGRSCTTKSNVTWESTEFMVNPAFEISIDNQNPSNAQFLKSGEQAAWILACPL